MIFFNGTNSTEQIMERKTHTHILELRTVDTNYCGDEMRFTKAELKS